MSEAYETIIDRGYTSIDDKACCCELKDVICHNQDTLTKLENKVECCDTGLMMTTEITPELAIQYHDLILANNENADNNSLVLRSVEELMTSKHVVMVVYRGKLLGAIRIQEQEGLEYFGDVPIYQRGSLIVHPDFRRKELGISISDYLIKKINSFVNHTADILYSITKNKVVINSNKEDENMSLSIHIIKALAPEFYEYVVNNRGQDFQDLSDNESINDYHVTINPCLKNKIYLTSIPTPDAQSV